MSDPDGENSLERETEEANRRAVGLPSKEIIADDPVGVGRTVITNDPVESGKTVEVGTPQKTHQLRLWTLWILVGIVGAGLLLVALGLAAHWFDSDFAKTILQTVVSPILGALSAVVGYLFADRRAS
ncbi:hypothetical protein [Amycolatopsis sp. CA-128772]|uniref:hypothetical protein n=1 Tax=Amycolatopsis sp. CA-128772 TaxID=2073159 RepID=UPI0011B0B25D|nr:hypothetical protein [Amycolatopsis sp. CA-128772]